MVDDLEREKETRADWSREGELLAAQVPNMLYLLRVLTSSVIIIEQTDLCLFHTVLID